MDDDAGIGKILVILYDKEKITFVFLYWVWNIHDAVSNRKNTWNKYSKRSARPRVFTGHFAGWNYIIHVSITAQKHSSNFLSVNYK